MAITKVGGQTGGIFNIQQPTSNKWPNCKPISRFEPMKQLAVKVAQAFRLLQPRGGSRDGCATLVVHGEGVRTVSRYAPGREFL